MSKKTVYTTSGTELIRKLVSEGLYIFTISEAKRLAPQVNISQSYVTEALYYLTRSGWIVRLKRGLYIISDSVPGVTSLHEFVIAMFLVSPAAISHWSAMSYYGFTEQIPRYVFVTTTSRNIPRHRYKNKTVTAEYDVISQIYKFIQIRSSYFFGINDVWINESKVKITDKERTLLDGLMMPHNCGNFAEVLTAFEKFALGININRLIEYALKLNVATVKRLGWILDHFNLASKDKLNLLQNIEINGYRLLDASGTHRGSYNSKWMIRENL